jgi:hypothetical protein
MRVVKSDDISNVIAAHEAGPEVIGPTHHPYNTPQNRFTTDWVDFVAEHVDVDRPGDR